MYSAAIGTAIASNGDKQYNMAMTKCADKRPTRECFMPTPATRCVITHNTSESSWSRSQESEARSAQAREQIWRNGEVDLLA